MTAPGKGTCPLCNETVWRYYTSGAPTRLTMFDEHDHGAWSSLAERAAYVAPGYGWLRPHNCLKDTAA